MKHFGHECYRGRRYWIIIANGDVHFEISVFEWAFWRASDASFPFSDIVLFVWWFGCADVTFKSQEKARSRYTVRKCSCNLPQMVANIFQDLVLPCSRHWFRVVIFSQGTKPFFFENNFGASSVSLIETSRFARESVFQNTRVILIGLKGALSVPTSRWFFWFFLGTLSAAERERHLSLRTYQSINIIYEFIKFQPPKRHVDINKWRS
jgi:hypothetical protein